MDKPVILFDGVCNFCNGSVNFIIKRDPRAKFDFCPLQTEKAVNLLIPFHIDPIASDTIILLRNNKLYMKSRAALEIVKELNGLWPVLYVLILVPPFIRNFFYSILAKNRYKWFGKTDACMVPSQEIRNRFLS